MKTKMMLSAALAAMFNPDNGFNFRVRVADGVTSIKPSTRPRGVKGEFGFGKFDPVTSTGEFGTSTLEGNYGVENGKYGWVTLIAGEGVTFSQVLENTQERVDYVEGLDVAPVEAAAAVVEVPAAGGELVVDGNIERVMMAGQHPAPVTIDEAIGILGITKDALRKRIARGSVRAALDEAGKVAGVFIDA